MSLAISADAIADAAHAAPLVAGLLQLVLAEVSAMQRAVTGGARKRA